MSTAFPDVNGENENRNKNDNGFGDFFSFLSRDSFGFSVYH